ncbi:MAG: hypothetical protein L7H04_02655 [Vulcanisaeta sp.]|nr:hypothetical protein [Vulcanisaeta sp.]MCG2885039.1 hypothetical protein [Vulcanisaeta sp.]
MRFDNVVIVEDNYRNFYPTSLSTPISDLIIGGLRYYEHIALWLMNMGFDAKIYVVTRDYLSRLWSGIAESLLSKVGLRYFIKYVQNTSDISGPSLIIHTSLLPRIDTLNNLINGIGGEVRCGNRVLLSFTDDGDVNNVIDNCDLPILDGIWSVIRWNTYLLRENLKYLVKLVGDKVVDSDVSSNAVIDEKGGNAIMIGATVESLAYVRGPVLLGPGSRILPHAYVREGSVLYAHNVVGGEIKNSIMDMHSLKEHFSYLGDSYVGRWVNIGAGSVTSNLKNTMGVIRYGGINTGLTKLGSVIGDWAKIGINTSIMSGKYIGQGSNVLGLIRANVPPFKLCINDDCKEYLLDKVVEVYKRFTRLRGVNANENEILLIRAVYDASLHEAPL